MSSSTFLTKLPLDIRFEIYTQIFKFRHTILMTPRRRKSTVFDALILTCKQIKPEIEKWAMSLPQRRIHPLFSIFNPDTTYFKVCFEEGYQIYSRSWTPREAKEGNAFQDIELWQRTMNQTGTTCACAWGRRLAGWWGAAHSLAHPNCRLDHEDFIAWFHQSTQGGCKGVWEEVLSPVVWEANAEDTVFGTGPLFARPPPKETFVWGWDFGEIYREHRAFCAANPSLWRPDPDECLQDTWEAAFGILRKRRGGR